MAQNWGYPSFFIILFHLLVFGVDLCGLSYDLLYIRTESGSAYGGKWKFLTFWCEVAKTIYFGLCLLNDVFGSNSTPGDDPAKRSVLQKIRDYLLATILFPMGSFVVISFWGIYAVDRELVFPKALDAVIPVWLNHVSHTTVIFFLLMDKYLVYHHYPSRKVGVSTTVAVGLCYLLWLFWIAYYADIWVYPVLKVLDWPKRLLFLSVLWVLLCLLYILGDLITTVIWGSSQKKEQKEQKKEKKDKKKKARKDKKKD